MWMDTAVEALEKGCVLELRYSGFSRWVEVHTAGTLTTNHPGMRVWQVRGGSVSNEPVGWKLMRLDEAFSAHVTDEPSAAPRPRYKRGDPAFSVIRAQI